MPKGCGVQQAGAHCARYEPVNALPKYYNGEYVTLQYAEPKPNLCNKS